MEEVKKTEVLQGELNRALKLRHMNMIAIGGAIGTGLFLSSGYTVNQGGPGGALLAYAVVGAMVYFLMTGLGEMATFMPVAGSFETYCNKFVDPAFGFAVGWLYWVNWALTMSAEIVAAQIIVSYWLPNVPGWIWVIVFVVGLFTLNLISVKGFGESEFWFAGIKVVAIILFLIIGILMIVGVLGDQAYGVKNFLTDDNGGAFPNGGLAVIMVLFSAAFSFTGVECIGMAVGESADPDKNVPMAIKNVFWRILLFYIGGIFVIGCIIPYQQAGLDISPFTFVFSNSNIPGFSGVAATIMNAVILTSILSCTNSGLYVASRMLWSMAREKKAPAILGRVNPKSKVPVPALVFTTAFGLLALITSFLPIAAVYTAMIAAVGLSTLIGWVGIALSHYRFRKWYVLKGYDIKDLKYKAKLFPFGPVLCLILCIVVIGGQAWDPAAAISLYYGLPLFIILYLFYKIRYKTKLVNLNELELDHIEHLKYKEEEEQ